MTTAYINRITTAIPPHDVHWLFQNFMCSLLDRDAAKLLLFRRMAKRAGIEHRFFHFYRPTNCRWSRRTQSSRRVSEHEGSDEQYAPTLAQQAVERLLHEGERGGISHLIVTCCTGFSARSTAAGSILAWSVASSVSWAAMPQSMH